MMPLDFEEEEETTQVKLSSLIIPAYKEFWTAQATYFVVGGGRGSGKSTQTSLKLIVSLLQHEVVNILCIRKTLSSLKDSCYASLEWATKQLGVHHLFQFKVNPLEIVYTLTGQKILFRGLDEPDKITSLTVATGIICRVWFEEAFQIKKEEEFDKVTNTIRGILPEGLRIEYYLTFNTWSAKTWIKKRFFDPDPLYPDGNPRIYKTITNYKQNPYLNKEYVQEFDELALKNPKWYLVNCLGHWGSSEGAIYDNWEIQDFDTEEVEKTTKRFKYIYGLDFGWNDPTAFFCGLVDLANRIVYVFDEIYQSKLTYLALYRILVSKGYGNERIIGDSRDKTAIQTLREMGLRNLLSSKKGAGSILTGIHKIQDYKIIVHSRCKNFIDEILGYEWKQDRNEDIEDVPNEVNNHLMDAFRYAMEQVNRRSIFYIPKMR